MIEIFTRKLPPTSNHRLMPMCMGGRGRLIKTKKFREWEAEMADDIPNYPMMEDVPLWVVIHIRFPDKRKRDIDGPVKPILDLLVRHGCIKDDSRIERLEITKYVPGQWDQDPGTFDVKVQTMEDYRCPF